MKDLKLISDKIESQIANKADSAQWTVSEDVTHEFSVLQGEFSLYRTLFDNNIVITTFKDQKKGSADINKFDDSSIETVINTALSNAESGIADPCYAIAPDQGKHVFTSGDIEGNEEKLFQKATELLNDIKTKHSIINIMEVCLKHRKVHKVYRNTNGSEFDETFGEYDVSIEFTAQRGEKTTSLCGSYFQTTNLDTPFIQMGTVEQDLINCEKQLDMESFSGKFTGTIILTPSCLSSFIQSAADNFAGPSVILNNTSLWKDKLGKQVADKRLTIGFNSKDKRIVCGRNYTQDGFLSKDFNFIENGVLTSFLLDLFTANKTGFKPAPNTDYDLIIEPGDKPLAQIISETKQGLIFDQFSGGTPGANGEFSGVAKNAFYIENGKIVKPVNEVMVNGNLADLFNNIQDISSEQVCPGYFALPYISFGGIVVSGK